MALTVLDASVVIGLLDATDPHHGAAVVAIRERLAAPDRMVIPASAYAELLVGPMRRGPEAVEMVDALLAALPAEIIGLGVGVARAAAALRAEHAGRLRLPDAFVLGTAIDLDADLVLTADRRWPTMDRVSVAVIGR